MRKTKKQLLGLVCLAAVALMTAFAISLPAPGAAAADEDEPASSEGNTQVQVRVEGVSPACHIESPTGNKTYVKSPIPVRVRCTKSRSISVTYKYKDEAGNEHSGTLVDNKTSANYDAEVVTADLALSDYADGVVITATATGNNGTESVPDSVSFNYRAISTEISDKTDPETGNPSLDIDVSDDVEDVQICVYDKSGKPVFASKDDPENGCVNIKLKDIDKNGNFEVTMPDGTVIKGTYDSETGEIHVELPMDKSGAGEGEYTVIVVGTDKNGNIVSMNRNDFTYKPVTPELPNTGSIFGDLNISKADYLVTGLIAFGLTAGFAMILIFRRNHRN